ncbi:MAG TPA: hypothetical protein VLI39_04760 [Sedimentisphaerales bacterium]|nr:hypothetical protein [Sedimentisphaerales bacterium]
MGLYGIFMILGVLVVGGGWIAYWLHNRKLDREEAMQPKQYSQQRKKTSSEVSDWAKKMAEFKGPPKRPGSDQKPQDE